MLVDTRMSGRKRSVYGNTEARVDIGERWPAKWVLNSVWASPGPQ